MAKRVFGLGILAIVLVFGMAVTGCGGNDNGERGLDGTWIRQCGEERLVLSGANFTSYWREYGPWENDLRGTFSVNLTAGTIGFTATQVWEEDSWETFPERIGIAGNISVIDNIFVLSGFHDYFDWFNGTWTRQ